MGTGTVEHRDHPAPLRAPALRCLVVDSQPATLGRLVGMLHATPSVAQVVTASDATGALRALRDVEVDVAVIDVQLPGMDGMELAWVLRRFVIAPAVVFVGGAPQRAAEAFDVGAVDYLGKPPPADRLAESLRRVTAGRHAVDFAPPAAEPPAPAPADTDDEAIPVEVGRTTRLVRRSSVRWVQAQGDYVRLHTADGTHLIRARIAALADCWRSAGLVRIHRSYLVQLRFVTDVRQADPGQLTVVVDGHQLPVSRRMAPTLRAQMIEVRGEGSHPLPAAAAR